MVFWNRHILQNIFTFPVHKQLWPCAYASHNLTKVERVFLKFWIHRYPPMTRIRCFHLIVMTASAVTMEINLPKVRTSTASIPSACSSGGRLMLCLPSLIYLSHLWDWLIPGSLWVLDDSEKDLMCHEWVHCLESCFSDCWFLLTLASSLT